MRRHRPDPLPRRRSDRIEDAVVWLLVLAGLVLLAAAVVVGLVVHGDLAAKSHVQQSDRTQVTAVVAAPVPSATAPGATSMATVTWKDTRSATHTEQAFLAGPRSAGDAVQIWVSRDGAVVEPPLSGTDAMLVAWIVGFTVLMLGGSLLGVAGWGAMRWVWSLHAATWAHEWEKIEPDWRLQR